MSGLTFQVYLPPMNDTATKACATALAMACIRLMGAHHADFQRRQGTDSPMDDAWINADKVLTAAGFET